MANLMAFMLQFHKVSEQKYFIQYILKSHFTILIFVRLQNV